MTLGRLLGWRAGSFLVTLFAATPAHALCGDGVWDEDEQCDDGNVVMNDACNNQCRLSCETIDDSLTSHTCGHGDNGPFVDMAAQAYPGFVYSDISASHTYFTLTLSGDAGENRSGVLYSPGVDWVYAFYLKENYPLSVLSSAGEEVPLVFEHEITMCGPPLTWVKAFELSSQDTYTLVFGPTEEMTASVAVELMGPSTPNFFDRDGDAHGGALAGLGSCNYDAATVEEPGDCDDDDADIHPGAPAPELCDGVDSDCSGDDDAGVDGLCSDESAGSACVDTGAVIRCGCAVDADCEGEATCNVAEQRCETESGAGGAGSGVGGSGEGGEMGTTAGAAGAPTDGGTGGAAAGGSSSGTAAGGSSAAGEAGAAAMMAGAGGKAAETGGGDEPASDEGCGCRTAGGGKSSAGLGLLAAAVVGLLRRRRSRG